MKKLVFRDGRIMIIKDKPDIPDKEDKPDILNKILDLINSFNQQDVLISQSLFDQNLLCLSLKVIHFFDRCPVKFLLYMKSSFSSTERSKAARPLDRTLSSSSAYENIIKLLLRRDSVEN